MTKSELKDIIFECILEDNVENLINFHNEGLEILEEDTEYIDILEEGANLEAKKVFSQYKKQYKIHLRAAKKYIKTEDKDAAVKELKEAKKIIKECKNEINGIEFSDKENAIGWFLLWSSSLLKISIPILLHLAYAKVKRKKFEDKYGVGSTRGGLFVLKKGQSYDDYLKEFKSMDIKLLGSSLFNGIITTIIGVVENEKTEKAAKRSGMNLYKNNILVTCDKIIKSIDVMIDNI